MQAKGAFNDLEILIEPQKRSDIAACQQNCSIALHRVTFALGTFRELGHRYAGEGTKEVILQIRHLSYGGESQKCHAVQSLPT